jgi:hypothetical protein
MRLMKDETDADIMLQSPAPVGAVDDSVGVTLVPDTRSETLLLPRQGDELLPIESSGARSGPRLRAGSGTTSIFVLLPRAGALAGADRDLGFAFSRSCFFPE